MYIYGHRATEALPFYFSSLLWAAASQQLSNYTATRPLPPPREMGERTERTGGENLCLEIKTVP